jgi:hypothetical protein
VRRLVAMDDAQSSALILVFQRSVGLICSDWPVLAIWSQRERAVEETDLEVTGNAQCVLVCRQGLSVRCDPIERAEAFALASLQGGVPLGAIVEGSQALGGTSEVSSWLCRWMSLGLIVGLQDENR